VTPHRTPGHAQLVESQDVPVSPGQSQRSSSTKQPQLASTARTEDVAWIQLAVSVQAQQAHVANLVERLRSRAAQCADPAGSSAAALTALEADGKELDSACAHLLKLLQDVAARSMSLPRAAALSSPAPVPPSALPRSEVLPLASTSCEPPSLPDAQRGAVVRALHDAFADAAVDQAIANPVALQGSTEPDALSTGAALPVSQPARPVTLFTASPSSFVCLLVSTDGVAARPFLEACDALLPFIGEPCVPISSIMRVHRRPRPCRFAGLVGQQRRQGRCGRQHWSECEHGCAVPVLTTRRTRPRRRSDDTMTSNTSLLGHRSKTLCGSKFEQRRHRKQTRPRMRSCGCGGA
jgi:hypothetical protein